jgi:ABC-type transport system involved in multi-copper enzyme maturation permease subunit
MTGMAIFGYGVFSLVGLLVILGPLASAGAISQEREQRTLPALLNTPMSPFTIVAGKLVAAWAFVLWLALLSLPFLALGVIWGAVDVGRMAGVVYSSPSLQGWSPRRLPLGSLVIFAAR